MTKTDSLSVKSELAEKENLDQDKKDTTSDNTNEGIESNGENHEEKKAPSKKTQKRKGGKSGDSSQAKKPRVKPEKAQEVKEKMIEELAKNYSLGLKEVAMEIMAKAVGYKHPRSDAIIAAMKLLKEEDIATTKKNTCQFTIKGVEEYVKEEEVAANPEAAMEQFWKQMVMKLETIPKANNGKARENAQNIWNLLQDGKAHKMEDVLGVTSYGMERSTGFPEIIKALKELGFATKENKQLQFTDKVFPFGRPGV